MANKSYTVRASWDEEGQCWIADSDDVPGLATGADTIEELVRKLAIVVPELLEENGLLARPFDPVPLEIIARQSIMARAGGGA